MATSKRAKRVRTADEFSPSRLASQPKLPKGSGVPLTSWTLAQIFEARDAQLRGDFYLPAKMAEAMRTDEALSVPFRNRLAPQQCIKRCLKPAKVGRGVNVANEAEGQFGEGGVAVSAETMASIHECLVNHEISFAHNTATPRDDGTRVDFHLRAWPIENVRWDPVDRVYKTRTEQGAEEPIVPGDGRWVIFSNYAVDPFKHGAILAGSLIWARHAHGVRDMAKSSVSHGNAKVIGSLPEGVPLQDETGAPTAEAEAMSDLLRAIATGDSPVGIKPAKSTVEFITNNSSAWQIFDRLIMNAEKSAARLYLGTDAMLGAQGGAPGVDIQALFGVATTYVQSDLACLARGLQSLVDVWTAVNFGDSSAAPTVTYLIPDADADAARAAAATRAMAFQLEIKAAKENGFALTPEYLATVAERHGVEAPMLVEVADAAAFDAAVSRLLAEAASKLQGPPGPAGKDGKDGKDAVETTTTRPFPERYGAFLADLKDHRDLNLCSSQREIDQLAKLHDVPAPRLEAKD